MNMTSRERVLTVLDHKEADRVPKFSSFTPEFASRLRKHLGLKDNLINPHGTTEHDLDIEIGNDMLLFAQGFANSYYQSLDRDYVDEWGIEWKVVSYNTRFGKGSYTEISGNPLQDDISLKTYIPPDPKIESRYDGCKKTIQCYHNQYATMGVIVCTIFESAWALRGLNKLMIDLIENEETANKILDIPFNYHLYAARRMAELGVDLIWTGDDIGSQTSMIMSPGLWRKYFKPRMARLYSELKRIKSDLKIAYHSDGYIIPIIDDLVEIGLDILNPIQPKCMNPYNLKKRYGKNLSLWGTIDIQETLPFGTKEQVIAETKERISILGPGGGFIISPTHHIQNDTSIENFFAFWDSAEKFGKYPIVI